MKDFSKLLLRIMETEKRLAEKLVAEAIKEDPNAVITFQAHQEVYELLQYGYDVLKEKYPHLQQNDCPEYTHPPKLKVVK